MDPIIHDLTPFQALAYAWGMIILGGLLWLAYETWENRRGR